MVSQQIMQVIDQLSAKLAGPAKALWGIMVIQQARVGMIDLWVGGFLLLCFVVGMVLVAKWVGKDSWEKDDGGLAAFVFFILMVLLVVGIIVTVNGYLKVSNPAYYALMDLRNMIPK